MIEKTAPLDPMVPYYIRSPDKNRSHSRLFLSNTQKQMQRDSQNGETRNIHQMKEEEKSSEKELNEMEASNLSDTEFENMVIRL